MPASSGLGNTEVDLFKDGARQRYRWLRLLQERLPTNDFFADLDNMTYRLLSQHPILESSSGVYAKPSELVWVSMSFRDSQGKSLLTSDAPASQIYTTSLCMTRPT